MYKFSKNQRDIFLSGNMGLEREALRVDQHGLLAMTPFPEKLGDKVNNPHYTVDFSESQLEIITSVKHSPRELYNSLLNKTHYANQVLGQESLWPFSKPGKLPREEEIPMASFPDPQFKSKEMYRRGLVRRYGSYMQMISGIHYNFSFTAEQIKVLLSITGYSHSDQLYLALSRNFLRHRWLFILLFGASPVAHKQYIDSQSHRIA
nr:hypothetical protein [Spirochaetaceae bacterium]